MHKTKYSGLEQKKRKYGFLFVLPWLCGFILYFLFPLVQSMSYAFQKVDMSPQGLETSFIGLENFRYAFFTDPTFLQDLAGTLANLVQVPLILVYSLFVAYLIKDNFTGRTAMRAIAFLPVIIGSGVLMSILKEDIFSGGVRGGNSVYLFSAGGLEGIMAELGMGESLITFFNDIINRIFDMTWKSGVQIMLFLSGLHGIPGHVYEASSLEGARRWEQFWKITLPLLTPTILLNVVYSVIDTFMDYGNTMVRRLYDTAFEQVRFGYSSAISIVYFLMVIVVLGLVYLMVRMKINYSFES